MSTTQDLYTSSEQNQLNPQSVAKTKESNAQLVEKSRNSNFTLSQSNRPNKFTNTTSAGDAFTPEKLAFKEKAQVGNPLTMRAANFQMGFEQSMDYGTTSDQNNKFFRDDSNQNFASQLHQSQIMAQKDRVTQNRVPHYDFGRTPVDYKTSVQNQYTRHDLSQTNLSKIAAMQNGKDVRQSHFLFGTDTSENKNLANPAPNTTKSSMTPLRDNMQMGAAQTNIQIQHNGVAQGANRFTSSYRSSNSMQTQPKSLASKAVNNFSRKQSADVTASKTNLANKQSIELRKAHFSLGNDHDAVRSTNQSNLNSFAVQPNTQESRNELKARMAKTQFSFGPKENSKASNQTMYSSEIDAQARQGGQAANGREVRSQLKRTNITIGTYGEPQNATSEAQQQYVRQRGLQNGKEQQERNLNLVAKLKGHNFTLREQKQGGLVNNYFQTSHNSSFNVLGNPNEIRSRIPDAQRADARNAHYTLGFDKSTFKPRADQTYNFSARTGAQSVTGTHTDGFHRANRSLQATSLGGGSKSNAASNSLIQASLIANKQKQTHITMGGAPSAQKSTQGDRRTSNQSFFRWIQPKIQ